MKKRTKDILDILKEDYPDAKCELNHESPFQLLVATILSAQTTDKKVNEVTETLFRDYPDLDAFLTLSVEELEERIKQIGLYRSKAKNLIMMCNQLKEKFNGEVPRTMEEITSLAGAGRKTANVFKRPPRARAAIKSVWVDRSGCRHDTNPQNHQSARQRRHSVCQEYL